MEDKLIELKVAGGVATIHLNRPDKRNAMNDAMRAQFIEALEHVNVEKSIRALVLTGNGKGFCSGGDIGGMEKRLQEPAGEVAYNGWRRMLKVHDAAALLFKMPKPTIAAVNGSAAGLGADTALACDFVVASEAASFTWSYIHRGLIPDGGGMYFLPRRVGLPKAKELIYGGGTIDAAEAKRIGIADRVSPAETLLADAQAWAADLATRSPTAFALSKSILDQSFEMSADQVFDQGAKAQGICYTSTEHRESVEAFLRKSAERAAKK